MGKITIAPIVGVFALTLTSAGGLSRVESQASPADELVRQLGQFPPAVGNGIARKDGSRDEVEDRRRAVYLQLRGLGQEALPALARGLADADVQIRRSTALFLGAMAGGWYDSSRPWLDIHACLGALTSALRDRDARVRQLAADAIGAIGPPAVSAVPALIILLMDSDEGSRSNACSALIGIGPAATSALPALRTALSDPSVVVRRFAQQAIERIDVPR